MATTPPAPPVLPTGYGYSVNKRPTFATLVHSQKSGLEVTRYEQVLPLWEFELTFEILRDETQNQSPYTNLSGFTEFQQLSDFFTYCNGQYGRFYFEDLSDCSRSHQGLGTGDGTTTNFAFVRTISDGVLAFTEPVGGVNQNHTVTVYKNGVPFASAGNWSITADNRTLVFNVAPANGIVITADFYYYYLCRFASDDQEFEEFLYSRWLVKSLKFRSVIVDGGPAAPGIVSSDWGRVDPTITPTNQLAVTLPAANPDNVVVLAIINARGGDGTAQVVSSILNTTGSVVFGRLGGGDWVDVPNSSTAVNLEFWVATTPVPLSGEAILITFDRTIGVGIAIATAIGGTTASPDPGVPVAVFGSGAASATITTTNANDLLIWAAGGGGIGNGAGPPTGFTSLFDDLTSVSFHDSYTVVLSNSYRLVHAIQTGLTLVSTTAGPQTSGVCLAGALQDF